MEANRAALRESFVTHIAQPLFESFWHEQFGEQPPPCKWEWPNEPSESIMRGALFTPNDDGEDPVDFEQDDVEGPL